MKAKSAARPLPGAPSELRVEALDLDAQNPRLAVNGGQRSQEELVKFLWSEMAVDELALSIAANGFFREEPLFVIPKDDRPFDDPKKKYFVVEGNRRLAAVLLLRDPDGLGERVGADELPVLSAQAKKALDLLPVSVYADREALWQYFGFRHINGPKPWDAYAKAKYVALVHEKFDEDLDVIARSIGDRHTTVERLYRGYKLLEQAEEQAGFSPENRVRNRFYFSHLYTAADQPEFQAFLGIRPGSASLKRHPVPRAKLEHLSEFMLWLYGDKSRGVQPVIRTQNPDLNTLRNVLAKPRGLAALRVGASLERAAQAAAGDKRLFREALVRSQEDLREAKATVTNGYTGDNELFDVIREILPVVESIHEEMVGKRKKLGKAK
jgi:hypothetical protein